MSAATGRIRTLGVIGLCTALGVVARADGSHGAAEVSFRSGWIGEIHGTLSLPERRGGRPATMVVAPEEAPGMRLHARSVAFAGRLAGRALDEGVAVLRYELPPAAFESRPGGSTSYRLRGHALDAALHFVRSRPELDPRRVILFGRSGAATDAAVAAGTDHALAGLVLVSAPIRVQPDPPIGSGEDVGAHADYVRSARHAARDQATAARRLVRGIRCPVLLVGRDPALEERIDAEIATVLEEAGNHAVTRRMWSNLDDPLAPDTDGSDAARATSRTDSPALDEIARWTATVPRNTRPWWRF